jgi:hypothetical protein
MMMIHIHVAFLVLWIAVAVYQAVGIATSGAEEAHLATRRGENLRARTELKQEQYNLRKAIDDLAKQAHIDAQVRRLGLDIEAPPSLASSAFFTRRDVAAHE